MSDISLRREDGCASLAWTKAIMLGQHISKLKQHTMETLSIECFNEIFLHLELSDLTRVAATSKVHACLLGVENNQLWNLLLCQRLWRVDPSTVLFNNKTQKEGGVLTDWWGHFRTMITAEQNYQSYLTNLKLKDLDGWIERHFLGQLAPHWNGWESRFWALRQR